LPRRENRPACVRSVVCSGEPCSVVIAAGRRVSLWPRA
jgi:hypothetical protein